MVKKVLVTGASGAVGHEALKELFNRKDRYDIRIFCLDRPYERKLFSQFKDMEIFWGDIQDYQDVQKAVHGVDYIIHTAGIIPPLADENPDLAGRVNVEGTRNLIQAMKSEHQPPKIVFTSSISVYGDRIKTPNIVLGDPINPSDGDEYARTKISAEKIIRESGVPWTIFRLCGILVKTLKIQPLMFHMPLDTPLEWCHPSDAGYALVESLAHESVLGEIYNLGGGEKCRIMAHDFMESMFNLWGLSAKVLPKYAFAIQNFHSGYYADGYKLNEILHFQRKTLQDYLETIRNSVSPFQKVFVKFIPRRLIRGWLTRMSEPLKAIRENNEVLIQRFYGSRNNFNQLLSSENS